MPFSDQNELVSGSLWTVLRGSGPLVATAIHDGHGLRDEVRSLLALSDEERLREEDPGTGRWTEIAPNRVIVHRSRFEVDLNRPRAGCVYRTPEEAWGLRVWREPPSDDVIAASVALYEAFYAHLRRVLDRLVAVHGRFVVFDLHSYNHRRAGPDAPPADPAGNPDVNLGTGSMDRERWGPVVEAFLESLRGRTVGGRSLDVRENVRFQGGWFSRWVHESWPEQGCALAIEVKKTFMDEWTGKPDVALSDEIRDALGATTGPVLEALRVAPPTAAAGGGS